jgi:hypothetical protein
MRRIAMKLAILACTAMLAIQAGGVHLHAESGDHGGGSSHGIHVEQTLSGKHASDAHEGHVDLSLFKSASGFSNVDMIVHVAPAIGPFPACPSKIHWFAPEPAATPLRFCRLRPPLRAPPAIT